MRNELTRRRKEALWKEIMLATGLHDRDYAIAALAAIEQHVKEWK